MRTNHRPYAIVLLAALASSGCAGAGDQEPTVESITVGQVGQAASDPAPAPVVLPPAEATPRPLPEAPSPSPLVPAEEVRHWLASLPTCGNDHRAPPLPPKSVRDLPAEAVTTITHVLLSLAGKSGSTLEQLETLAKLLGETATGAAAEPLGALYRAAAEIGGSMDADSDLARLDPEVFKRHVRNNASVIRRAAIRALEPVPGEGATSLLAEALDDGEPGIRFEAARVLSTRAGFPEKARVTTLAARTAGNEEEAYYAAKLKELVL